MPTSFQEQVDDVRNRFVVTDGHSSPEHERLLKLVKDLKRKGEDAISSRIADMQKADEIYRAYRVPDEDDVKASEKGEPVKIIYPITYAQIQAAIAGEMQLFLKQPYVNLQGRGPKDFNNAKLMEVELQYQLEQAAYAMKFYQWRLDTYKYGFGKLNIGYTQEWGLVTKPNTIVRAIPMIGALFGLSPDTIEKQIISEGCDLDNEDPYCLLFDPSVSVGEFQKGNFVFSYFQATLNELKDNEEYFNLEGLSRAKDVSTSSTSTRNRKISRRNRTVGNFGAGGQDELKGGDYVDVDVCYVKLIPRDYALSESNRLQIWKIAMANDERLIKIEPSKFEHGQFPSAIAEYSPDLHEPTNDGMAQTIDGLQFILNWLLNSHIESVRKTVNNSALVDPDAIHVEDLEKRRNYIRIKRGKANQIDRIFKQLVFQDVTQSHVNDANMVLTFIQRATGLSDNSLGVQLPTGRTATEVAALQRMGSARAQMSARLFFESGIRPMTKQLIANTQQFLTTERFIRVNSDTATQLGIDLSLIEGNILRLTKDELKGFYDIQMTDLNTPQDNLLSANLLKEVLMMGLQNPIAFQMFGLQPQQILNRIFTLTNIPGISDIMAPPIPAAQMAQMAQRGVKAQVMPEEMIAKEAQKGNLVPFQPEEMNNGAKVPGLS